MPDTTSAGPTTKEGASLTRDSALRMRDTEPPRLGARVRGALRVTRSIEPFALLLLLAYDLSLLLSGALPLELAQAAPPALLVAALALAFNELRREEHDFEISLRVLRAMALALCAPLLASAQGVLPPAWVWALGLALIYPCGLPAPLAAALAIALALLTEAGTVYAGGRWQAGDALVRCALLEAVAAVSYALGRTLGENERAQRSKRLRQARNDIIGVNSNAILVFTDRRYRLVQINHAVQRALGYSPQQLRRLWSLELLHPEDRSAFLARRTILLKHPGDSEVSRLRLRHADGHWAVFDVRITNLLKHPAVHGFFASAVDCSLQVRAEESLQGERQVLRAVIDHLRLSIYTKDREARYVMSNPTNVARLGYRDEREILGYRVAELDPDGRLPAFDRDDSDVLTGNSVLIDHEVRVAGAEGARWYQLTKLPLTNPASGVVGLLGMVRDITESRAAQNVLLHHATHDPLTGLHNRRFVSEHLATLMEKAADGKELVALLFCDLDLFKAVNDRYGHEIGDRFLTALGERLEPFGEAEGRALARFGGDEFVLLAPLEGPQAALALAQALLDTIAAPIQLGELILQANVSIGVATLNADHRTPEDLIRDADAAMYLAKSQGRNRIVVFDDIMRRRNTRNVGLTQALRGALDRSELYLIYQPKVDLRSGLVAGFEALLRWESEEYGPVPPTEFIPLAEESGLIVRLGMWALEQACLQLRRWQSQYPDLDHLTIAVNVSMRQLTHPSFLDDVVRVIETSEIYPTALELELTESAAMLNIDESVVLLGQLRDRGLRLALDDFGTGYSSLAHLRRLPVQVLKIDRMFVRGLESENDDSRIVKMVIGLADALHLQCVAEGIENRANASEIARLGCDLGQGYYFSRALPALEAGALLELNPAFVV